MAKMFSWTCAGAGVGFAFGAVGAFFLGEGLRPAPFAVLITIATPIGAVVGALFGVAEIIRDELRETRREMKAWQASFRLEEDIDKPSTQFKSGPGTQSR